MDVLRDNVDIRIPLNARAADGGCRGQFSSSFVILRSPIRRATLSLALISFLALSVCGCTTLSDYVRNGFKVGPNYSRPEAPVASEWIDYKDPRVKSQEADMSEWWRAFNDPTLSALI